MVTLKYKEFSDAKFEVVGRDEVTVATVEKGEDGLWHILPRPQWERPDGFNDGPFNSSEEAFEEFGAVLADQS